MRNVVLIAHRGHGPTSLLSGDGKTVPDHIAPENTLKAFKAAVEQGADGIEFDVYLTKDGHPVVVHDDELNRNVEGAKRTDLDLGKISEKTLAEVQQYNVGQGEKIPSLKETFDFFVSANTVRASEGGSPT